MQVQVKVHLKEQLFTKKAPHKMYKQHACCATDKINRLDKNEDKAACIDLLI